VTDSNLDCDRHWSCPECEGCQWLFPEDGSDRSKRQRHLAGLRDALRNRNLLSGRVEALARKHPNFHYIVTLSRAAESWTGNRGYVQDYVAKIVEERAARLGLPLIQPVVDPSIPKTELEFDIYSYICGLTTWLPASATS